MPPLISEMGARELESFLMWHKTTKDWLRPDRPFETVRMYNLILDYYLDLEDYYRANQHRGDEKAQGRSEDQAG